MIMMYDKWYMYMVHEAVLPPFHPNLLNVITSFCEVQRSCA